MADSNAPWRNRPGHLNAGTPNSNSPLSPASGGSNPLSFRPNVNRAKTKRWVEAKQYSYDGGDWGSEDEEEEEEEEQPPAAPRPPYTTQRTTSSSELSSRRLSGLGFGGNTPTQGTPTAEPKENPIGNDQRNPPVVGPIEPTKATQNAPTGLPEVKRFSGFGTDFFTGTDSNQQTTSSEQNSLRHNPSQASDSSLGFTSVVHQAFDVPETPDSTAANSVARSNSDGTSVISPIMGHRGIGDDKTPTIPEEPAEASTPTGAPQAASTEASYFKPGHRRDLSLPERDNSPSRRPQVTDHEGPSAGQAELTSVSPGQDHRSPERSVEAENQPTIPPTNTTDGDFVAPLKFGSAATSGSEGYRGSIPAIVGANTSPGDADNDRLREEIMRSLSRENSQEPEERPPQPEVSREESIPNEYEKYWDGQTGPGDGTSKPLASEAHPEWSNLSSRDPYAAPQTAQPTTTEPPKKPKLGRRFSWESASSAGEPAQPPPDNYASTSDGLAQQEPLPIPDLEDTHLAASQVLTDGEISGTESQKAERPRLSIVPPVSQNITPPEQILPRMENSQIDLSLPDYTRSSTIDESKLQGFGDILKITTPAARVRAFEETRTQFAKLDTGLNHWLEVTLRDQPQHSSLVQESQSLSSGFPKTSPTTRRFPKLTSLGNLSASREDSTPIGASHIRRPSGHIGTIVNRQNVEQRGKEFLHTAGTFGGKAGEAAKGLFAKGRSKFRQGNDKGQSPSARKSMQFQFSFQSESANSTGYSGKTPRRSSLNFNSLPVFKFGRDDTTSSTPDFGAMDPASIEDPQDVPEERGGKRLKSTGPSYLLEPSNKSEESGVAQAGTSFMTDFEQEMNAAWGLSPTSTRAEHEQPQPSTTAEPIQPSRPIEPPVTAQPNDPAQLPQTAVESIDAPKQAEDLRPPSQEESDISVDAAEANMYLASLPLGDSPVLEKDLLTEHDARTDDSASSDAADPPSQSGIEASHTTIPTIHAASEEDTKPQAPPTDVSSEEAKPTDLPPAPARDLEPKSEPPADQDHETIQQGLAPSQNGHMPRQASISTLGNEDQAATHSPEEVSPPPSPINATHEGIEDSHPRLEETDNDKALPPTRISQVSLPPVESVESAFPGFTSHVPRPQSSQEILESKRRSISGLPPSAPGVQSPLRNEVRYSPGTRSSMLSFGSFGRQSTGNTKGTRPNTPGNDLSQQNSSNSQNGDSKMDKLKSFGRRRRASVGNLISGIQGELQGGIQGIQEKSQKSQKKRGFSRISGFFGRQQEPQAEKEKTTTQGIYSRQQVPQQSTIKIVQDQKTKQDPLDVKALPAPPPFQNRWYSSGAPGQTVANRSSMEKALPVLPPAEDRTGTARSSLDQSRASLSGPPMGGSRFYSQLMSGETQASPQHTRSQSQPLFMSHPLSPVAPSESEHSSPDPSASFNEVAEERSPTRSNSPPPVPPKSPVIEQDTNLKAEGNPNEQARTHEATSDQAAAFNEAPRDTTVPTPEFNHLVENHEPKNIIVASATASSPTHPHRDSEPRTLNETSEPVELALTRDDSSEEIVMSPTAYPGQEWTPMHYYQ